MKCSCIQYSQSRAIMGRVARLSVVAPAGRCFGQVFDASFEAMERFEHRVNRSVSCSEISRLAACDVGEYVRVSDQLWQMLQLANEIAYRTDGLFDVIAAGSDGKHHWTDMDLSRRGFVRLAGPVVPDLGGLKKGYAADLAVQALKEMGVQAGLVDIGGCIRAFGQRAWRVDFWPACNGNTEMTGPAIPINLYESAIVGLGSMFPPTQLLDVQVGNICSTVEWSDMNLLVRASSAAVADALAKVSAVHLVHARTLLRPFGAEPIIMTSEGVESPNYVS